MWRFKAESMLVLPGVAAVVVWTVLKSQPCKPIELGPWIRRYVAQVKRNWFIPYQLKDKSDETVIEYKVLRDGSVRGIAVISEPKYEQSELAAVNAVKWATAPALPSDFSGLCFDLKVHFYYNMAPKEGDNFQIGDPCECIP